MSQLPEEEIYYLGTKRMVPSNIITNPFSIGPACIAIASGIYTKDKPLDFVFLEYDNPRFNCYVDEIWFMATGMSFWHNVGIQIKKFPDDSHWLPNLMHKITLMDGLDLGNWINMSPVWMQAVGFDQIITPGETLRAKIYNTSGTTGYIWIKIVGHYELPKDEEPILEEEEK